MIGNIRAKGKCPSCNRQFTHVPRLGYLCATCKTTPKRFFVDLFWQGTRIRIFSDSQGQALDSYERARALQARIHHEVENHLFDPARYLVSEQARYWTSGLLDRFLNYKIDGIAPSYQKDYRRMVSTAKEHFGTKDVRDLRKIDLINYQDWLTSKGTTGKSQKNFLDHFKTFLRYCAHDLEIIPTVPAFPAVVLQEYQFKWLSQEDQAKLFDLIPDADKPIIAFLMLHGCRPSEARALKCKDVNPHALTITISATWSGRVYRERRKGRGSRALIIPIHPEIAEYVLDRAKSNLPEAWLFPAPNGRHYTANRLRNTWKAVRKAAGISADFRLYDATRHSFASNLVNSGTTLFKVSRLLGHSSVKMTEKYAHSNIDSLKSDLEKLTLKKATVTNVAPGRKRA